MFVSLDFFFYFFLFKGRAPGSCGTWASERGPIRARRVWRNCEWKIFKKEIYTCTWSPNRILIYRRYSVSLEPWYLIRYPFDTRDVNFMYRVKYTLVRFNYHIVTFSDEGNDFRIEAACVCRTRREKSLLFPDLRRASSNEHHLSFFARTCSLSFFPVFFFLPSFLSLFLEAPSISRRGRYSSSLNPISYKLTSPSLSVHCPYLRMITDHFQSVNRTIDPIFVTIGRVVPLIVNL